MDARTDLLAEYPLLAQVSAPSTDKDAYIPVHRGAAAFYEDTQQPFLDKYGNELFLIPMALGLMATFVTAARKFVGFDSENAASVLEPLMPWLVNSSRPQRSRIKCDRRGSMTSLAQPQPSNGKNRAADAAALSLAAQRLGAIWYRRAMLPPS